MLYEQRKTPLPQLFVEAMKEKRIYNFVMNIFETVLEEIKKEYPLRRMNQTYAQIEFLDFDYLFNGHDFIFIGVLYEDEKVFLTDFADYAPLSGWEEEDLPEVEKICQKHGITFRNWTIECLYQSNDDVKRYLECLFELREKYSEGY